MALLRTLSDERFKLDKRKVVCPDYLGGFGYKYGYFFNGKWYSDQQEPAPPGGNNTFYISKAKAAMLAHQDAVFPKYKGVRELVQIAGPMLPTSTS
jgi:hypothetical protein